MRILYVWRGGPLPQFECRHHVDAVGEVVVLQLPEFLKSVFLINEGGGPLPQLALRVECECLDNSHNAVKSSGNLIPTRSTVVLPAGDLTVPWAVFIG
jgi:hypothetical protein